MRPPFISARAIETRCCCPPESWLGRCCKPLAQPERAEQFSCARIALRGRHPRIDRRHLDVLERRRGADEVVALEHEPERLAPQARQLVALEARDILAHEAVGAGGRAIEAAEDVHQRGLARARGAHDRKVFARIDLQADPVQHLDVELAAAVGLGHVHELDQRHARRIGRRIDGRDARLPGARKSPGARSDVTDGLPPSPHSAPAHCRSALRRGRSRRLGSDHDLFAGLEAGDDLRGDAVHHADFHVTVCDLAVGVDHAHQRDSVGELGARIGARARSPAPRRPRPRACRCHRAQRGERNQHRVLRARGDEEHLRRHLGHQHLVRVRHVEQGVVEHDVVHHVRRGRDLAQFSVEAAVVAAQRGEVDIHADVQLRHVRFRDLGLHRHRRQVRDAHDDGRLLVGVQRLALLCRLRDDGPRNRRVDLGVAEVRLVAAQRGLRLLHLRLDRIHLGQRRLLRRLGDLQRVGRGRVLAREVLLARELQFREHELRLLVGELRLLVEQLRLIAVDFGLVDRRVDLGEKLPGLDDRADVHVQLLQLSGDLRADIDEVLGLERPGRGDRILQVPALGHRREEASARGVLAKPCPPCVVAARGEQGARGKHKRVAAEPEPARAPRRAARKSVLYGNWGFGIRGHVC